VDHLFFHQEQYQTQIRILEDGHCREKGALTKQLKEVNTDMQTLKVSFVYIHLICRV
jgi:hypothetical protein